MKKGSNTMDRMSALSALFLALALGACSYDTDKFSQPDNGDDEDAGDDDSAVPSTCDGVVTEETNLHFFIRNAKELSRHDVWLFVDHIDAEQDDQLTLTATERFHGITNLEVDSLDTLEFFIPRALTPGRNVVRVFFDINGDHKFTKKGDDPELTEAEPGYQVAPCNNGVTEIDLADPPALRGDLNDPVMVLGQAKFTAKYENLNSSHTGQFFELRLYDDETNRVVLVDHLAQVDMDDSTVISVFEGALARDHEYTAQIVADVNGDGLFRLADFDHHWVRTVKVEGGDGSLMFAHTPDFETVVWEEP